MSFFEDVQNVLGQSNILNNPLSEAVKGVQKTVQQLVNKAGLPHEIAIRYTEFAEHEGLLYSAESYRDHFFHPFHTFLLGFRLMGKLRTQLPQHQTLPFPVDDDLLKKWLLASSWHDITYVAEKGPNLLEGFIKEKLGFNIRAYQDWMPVLTNEDNVFAIDTLSLKFESKDWDRQRAFRTWLQKLIEKHDHGVLSAILLLNDARKGKWLNKDMFEECSLSIALHNYHKAPASTLGSLKIKDYTLAFLLAYCDTAQVWGRPAKGQTTNYSVYYDDVRVDKDKNEIYILLRYDLNNFIKIKRKMGITFSSKTEAINKLIDEEREKFCEMENNWITDEWNYCITQIVSDNTWERARINFRLAQKKQEPLNQGKPSEAKTPALKEFQREKQAFLSLRESLKKDYFGEYVAIHGGEVVDSDTDESVLIGRFYEKYGNVPVYLAKIPEEEHIVRIPTPLRIIKQ